MNSDNILTRLVRVGIVMDVDANKLMARVKFTDADMTSGWLRVIQRAGGAVTVAADNKHSHTVHDTYTGGGSSDPVPTHNHPGTVTAAWMPKINDTVLTLYLPVGQGDGYVLGVI